MQIRHKLFWGYVGLTTLVVILGLYSIFNTQLTLNVLESGGTRYQTISHAANEAAGQAKRAQLHLMTYLALRDLTDRDKFFARNADLLAQVKILQTEIKDSKVREYVDQIAQQSGDLITAGQTLLQAYEKDANSNGTFDYQANVQTIQMMDSAADGVVQTSSDLGDYETNLQSSVIQNSIAQNKTFKVSAIGILIVLIIISNIIAFLLTRSIVKPLDQLRDSVNKIARGDRTVQTNIRSHDEVGNLARAFDIMAHEVDERRSELELVHEEERRQRLELEEESKARAQFINVLAHEMRTPLTPLMISIETIKNSLDSPLNSLQQKLIVAAASSVQSLKNRLDELLELAKFTRGDFKLTIYRIDAAEMVKRICESYQPVMDNKKQRLIIEADPNLPFLEGDLPRIEQVFLNLLSNASKYAPPDSEIRVRATQQNKKFLVEIIDQGIGISAEDQKKLFMPYHQVEQDRQQFPGIGLGLAVSKQIIEAHGGRIWVESEPGRGCKFKFELPFAHQDSAFDSKI